MKAITCIAPVNIAVIKYWGKRNETLILPINDSISSTLCTDQLCTTTTIMASPNFKENRFWINGEEESFNTPRLVSCLEEIKKRACEKGENEIDSSWKLHICSINNFPTAAGLASSAAGYACLVFALSKIYNVEGDISALARVGSGSACRSVYGGWVRWHMGEKDDGSDSIAKQLMPASHWPEMRIIILVVNDGRKTYSSTSAMRRGVKTSSLLKLRAETIVPEKVDRMVSALESKDFNQFAELTMRDSNQFHATCLDTYPPCFYLNDVSRAIMEFVHAYNDLKGTHQVAYTYDAGSNACLYTLEKNVDELMALIAHIFPTTTTEKNLKGLPVNQCILNKDLYKSVLSLRKSENLLKYIIVTKVGDGPQVLSNENSHLMDTNGFPKNCK